MNIIEIFYGHNESMSSLENILIKDMNSTYFNHVVNKQENKTCLSGFTVFQDILLKTFRNIYK